MIAGTSGSLAGTSGSAVEAPPERAVKPRVSRGAARHVDEPLLLDENEEPMPEPGEPSGSFIKRCLMADRWGPEAIAGFVLANYENRTTKVGDVYYNYKQLEAQGVAVPPWRGSPKREKPAAACRLIRSFAAPTVKLEDDPRPVALVTGSTPLQVGSEKTQLKILTSVRCYVAALEVLGYRVEWRPVIVGEDLSRYAVVFACLNKPNSIASRYVYGALWALLSRPDAILLVDDWQTEPILGGIKTFAVSKERAFRLFVKEDFSPEHEDKLFAGLQELARGDWRWPILAPIFKGGNVDLLKLPGRVVPVDPTAFAPRYPRAEGEPVRQWVQASLHEKVLGRYGWPVYQLGFQNRGKGGVGKAGEAAQDRLPEADLMAVYARNWGVVSPPHPHAGSGWWRVRFLMAADARRVLTCSPAEARVLDGSSIGPYSFASSPASVERMTDGELCGLAMDQASRLEKTTETSDEVLTKLRNLIKETVG